MAFRYMGPGRGAAPDYNVTETLFGRGKYANQQQAPVQQPPVQQQQQPYGPVQQQQQQQYAPVPRVLGKGVGPTSGGSTNQASGYISQASSNISSNTRNQESAAGDQRNALNAQIDAEFSNVMGQIGQQESLLGNQQTQLQNQLPLTEQQITQGFDETRPSIQQAQDQQLQNLGQQAQTAQTQTGGLIGQASRLFNELSTGASRFTGTSAAGAYGEILGRTTSEQIGNARNSLAQTLQGIEQERGQTVSFFNSKMQDLERNKNLAVQQAQQDFRAEIAKVNSAIVGLGQDKISAQRDKGARNLSALANFQQRVADIRDAEAMAKQTLDKWALERQSTLNSAKAKQVRQYKLNFADISKISNSVDMQKEGAMAAIQAFSQTGDPTALQGYLYNRPRTVGANADLVDPITGQPIGGGDTGEDPNNPLGLSFGQ